MSEEMDIENEPKKRPVFLKVLCILTFISTGLSLLAALINMIIGPMSEEQILKTRVDMAKSIAEVEKLGWDSFIPMMEQAQALSEDLQANFYTALIVALITAGLGLLGALKMWNGQRMGFHLYIIYCLISVGGVYLYANPVNVSSAGIIFGLFISGAFIFMYSRNLHWMK